jgi:hypothetical protein
MTLTIGRRELLAVLGGAAAAWPLAARAQQPGKIYRIGFLANDPAIPTQPVGQAFLDGLREDGFIEGKNIVIERRFAEGRLDRYADLVTELLRLEMDVLVTSAEEAAGRETGHDEDSHCDDECLRSARARHCRELGASSRQRQPGGPRTIRRELPPSGCSFLKMPFHRPPAWQFS